MLALKGHHKRLVPNIPLVVFDLVPFEEQTELILKGYRAVVFLLFLDIALYTRHVGFAHGKRAVPVLPMERAERLALSLHPLGRTFLDRLDDLAQGLVPRQHKERVNMIAVPAYYDGWTLPIAKDPRLIREQFRANGDGKIRLAILRAVNEVYEISRQ